MAMYAHEAIRLAGAELDLEAAFANPLRSTDAASAVGEDRKTLRTTRESVCRTYLLRQLEVLEEWVACASNPDTGFLACHVMLGHDSAKATMSTSTGTAMGGGGSRRMPDLAPGAMPTKSASSSFGSKSAWVRDPGWWWNGLCVRI